VKSIYIVKFALASAESGMSLDFALNCIFCSCHNNKCWGFSVVTAQLNLLLGFEMSDNILFSCQNCDLSSMNINLHCLKGRYSGRANFTHLIDIVHVKCRKTLFFSFFTPWCSELNSMTAIVYTGRHPI
jgi:hypothetical protein